MATAPTLFWYQLDTGTLAGTYFGQLDTTIAALCSENSVTAPTAPWQNQISCSLVSTWLKQIDTAIRSLCTILSVTPPATTLPNLNVGQYEATYWAQLDACVRLLCAAPPPYHADAVHFALDTILRRTTFLTGVVDTPIGIYSEWKKSATAQDTLLVQPGWGDFLVEEDGVAGIGLYADDTHANNINCISGPPSPLIGGAWHHLLIAWNSNFDFPNRIVQLYVDDVLVSDTDIGAGVAFDVAYAQVDSWRCCKQSAPDGSAGDVADYYFAPGQFLDFSVTANRRKFISASGKPVNLGADGSTPTGTAPAIFFSGDATTFATNKGTGGAFAIVNTALTNASTSPSD